MHPAVPTNAYIAGDLIGFAVGLAISTLLLVLTLRAAKLPGTPLANILLAVCSLAWNLGGAVCAALLALGFERGSKPDLIVAAFQFTAAAAWPVPLIVIWCPFAKPGAPKTASLWLLAVACVNAVVLSVLLWLRAFFGIAPVDPLTVKEFTAYNATLLLLAGLFLLRGRLASRTQWFGSVAILFGVLGSSVSVVILEKSTLSNGFKDGLTVLSEQSTLLIVLGAFFLFARFRFVDLFIRYSLRLILAVFTALALILLINAPFVMHIPAYVAFPDGFRIVLITTIAAVLLLAFAFVDNRLGPRVTQWIFHAPDHRKAARQLGERLQNLYTDAELKAATEDATRTTLELSEVRVVGVDGNLDNERLKDATAGELIELDETDPIRKQPLLAGAGFLVPISSAGKTKYLLAISPGPARRGLVTQEIEYLRMVATQLGNRVDSLRLEEEMFERRAREAMLLQQLTDAELRALRAQINPHFLFNSLNTIANLIVTDSVRAETMTLRLARVFRYVLAHSSQPLTSIGEEIEFLRTYLEIEEARFGERLKVEIDVAPGLAGQPIPSLLLQPLVENALKHGLAPKVGPGRLWISARGERDQIFLNVEDDGIGLLPSALERVGGNRISESEKNGSSGLGLTNVAQRLATLYEARARFSVTRREAGGTKVSLVIPWDNGVRKS